MEADHRQERSNHMKRKLLLLSVLAICVATLAAGTLAYFSADGTARNVITTGNVSIAVEEWANADKTQPFEDLTGIMPGTTVTKIAEVRNTGEADAWIRVRLTGDIRLTGDGTPDPSLVKPDLNTTDWTLGLDGYLYCNKAIRPGETTAPLFTCVTFDAGMGNEYQNATATVHVAAEAVQTANNGVTALEALGWPMQG
ncbi:MAG: hypothetical protein EGR01_01555 [Clostridiales bacterium]|nr:hypothetical protein [Clostridiales bacterium]